MRCRDCQRRMAGNTYGKPTSLSSYYRCPHNWANPKHAADHPDHPRSVQAPETRLEEIVGQFFATRIFGPERAALLAAQLPATDAQAIADRDAQERTLRARIARIEAAQDSKIIELEQLPADPGDTAAQAYRARIRARFAELHGEREQVEAQLKALAKTTPAAADTTLLDQLPLAGDVLPGLPPRLKARLFAAFDISVLWNKPGQQATVHAEITETTLRTVPGLLNPTQDGYHDTDPDRPEPIWDLDNPPRTITVPHPPGSVSCTPVTRWPDGTAVLSVADLRGVGGPATGRERARAGGQARAGAPLARKEPRRLRPALEPDVEDADLEGA